MMKKKSFIRTKTWRSATVGAFLAHNAPCENSFRGQVKNTCSDGAQGMSHEIIRTWSGPTINKSESVITTCHTLPSKWSHWGKLCDWFQLISGQLKAQRLNHVLSSSHSLESNNRMSDKQRSDSEAQLKPNAPSLDTTGPDDQNSDQTHALVMSWRLRQVTTAGDPVLVSFNIHQQKVRNSNFLLATSCGEMTTIQEAALLINTQLLLRWLQFHQCATRQRKCANKNRLQMPAA